MRRCLLLCILFISFPAPAKDRPILIYGDSLSTAYGFAVQDSWVALLEKRLQKQGMDREVVNASISGETSYGAKVRIDRLLSEISPAVTIIELGGNDGLRGLSMDEMHTNLEYIIRAVRSAGSDVLLIPIRLPPNYGPAYNDRLDSVYRKLAETHDITLGRFILDGIAQQADLMQEDGIHPREAAQPMMLNNVWADLKPLLEQQN